MAPLDGRRTVFWPVAPAVLIFAVVLGYGYWRVAPPEGTGEKGPRIALVQGSIDTDFEGNYRETCDATYRQYRRLSLDAVYKNPDLDLVVWPESMFGWPVVEFERGAARPPDFPGSQADWQAKLRAESDGSRQLLIDTTEALAAPLLVGISLHRAEPDGVKRYNTALLIDYDRQTEQARRMGRYDKMHLAPFGEYIPMSDVFPRLYDFTPLPGPMEAGKRAEAFPVGPKKQWLFAPSICYESILPHVMLRQLAQLRADGKEPDVMISITNDGWFWGSSALDMHMICSVFRAVELRKPFLSAANTGISAWVDADGRIIQRGPRRDTTVLTTEVSIDHRDSFYARTGDLFAYFCAGCTLLFAVVGFWQSRKFRKVSTAPVGGN
jgi:apolipoprotein N-acyltransferase